MHALGRHAMGRFQAPRKAPPTPQSPCAVIGLHFASTGQAVDSSVYGQTWQFAEDSAEHAVF